MTCAQLRRGFNVPCGTRRVALRVRDIRGARPYTIPCALAKPGAPAFAAAHPTMLGVAPCWCVEYIQMLRLALAV